MRIERTKRSGKRALDPQTAEVESPLKADYYFFIDNLKMVITYVNAWGSSECTNWIVSDFRDSPPNYWTSSLGDGSEFRSISSNVRM